MHRSFKTACSLTFLALLLALTVAARCWNSNEVFVAGKTFFVDPDCYSRMTRVARVYEHPFSPVHEHEFENWPQGVRPHTTAPFDYLTAALAWTLRPFVHDSGGALALAGAWISPLLAVLAGLALWVGEGRGRYVAVAFFAVSPILVHGMALGRPDHQSLLILCMAVALRAELALLEKPSRPWALAGGLAWGLGLWTSLYEPAVLLVVALGLGLALRGRAFFCRERLVWALALGALVLVGLAVDGWPVRRLDPVVLAYFANWSRTVGELSRASWTLLASWTGWLVFAAPLPLAWRFYRQHDARAAVCLGLLGVTVALTLWQARWGYFFALAFALALPPMLETVSKGRWSAVAWVVLFFSLWPVGREWDRMLDSRQGEMAASQRADNLALYQAALALRGAGERFPVMAPWWLSPALAYWSGQPCVAGSSHESLPGTVDSARFYLSPGLTAGARGILNRRGVRVVLAYDTDRVEEVCAKILGKPGVPHGEETLARQLFERPHSAPPGLVLGYASPLIRLYRYRPAP